MRRRPHPQVAEPPLLEERNEWQRRSGSAHGVVAMGSFFTVASGDGKAVYLTGSHIWNNFHDGMGPGPGCADTPEQLPDDLVRELEPHL